MVRRATESEDDSRAGSAAGHLQPMGGSEVLKLILVAALLMHGIGRVLGPMAAWTGLSSGFTGNPWIFGGNVAFSGSIGRLFSLVWVAALIVTVWAGVSLWSGNPNWRDLAIAAAALSLVAMVPWWNTITSGARYGGTLFNLLVLAVLLLPFGERLTRSLP
jgi:hypothetical protein